MTEPVATLAPMPTPVLRLVENGALGRYLPGWAAIEVGGDLGEQMVIALSWPTDSPHLELLGDQAEVAVLLDGVEIPDGRFVIDELADEEVVDADVVTRNGNSTLFGLSYAIVYPESGPVTGTNTTTPGWGFAAQTPGQALRELLEAAQARGWWPGLVWDFTDGVDSGGAAWGSDISEFYDMGTTLIDIVVKWKARKVAVAKMAGGTLQLYRYDNSGPDLTLSVPLFRDVDLTEGPVARSSRNTVSAMLVTTDGVTDDGGFGVTRVDNPALSVYGRREGFVSQSQVASPSILQAIGDGTLALKARQREAYTYGLTCSTRGRQPFVDYDRGAEVTLRVKGETRVMRVRQLTVRWEPDGSCSGSAAFGDRSMETDEQLAARLEQLTNGSMDGGVFGQPVLGSPDQNPGGGGGDVTPDTMPPAAPTGLSASSVAVFNQGYLSATATLTWVAPTTNQDGSALNDLGAFEVQYRNTGYPLWVAAGRYDKDASTAVVERLTVGADYDWRVRAFDIWGNASSWVVGAFTATNDIVAPAQTPSTPVVATFLFSGLMVTWDGKAQGGTAIDNDIRHVEVHLSTVNNFAPGAGTLRDRIDIGGGATVLGELTPGTTYYVKFRSVDWAGNLGPSSAQATGVPDSVQAGDIANGAVTTLKLADLAVTDAKIGSLSVTKLTAGTLSAVVTLSGEFRTAASGQRVVINASGVKLYDAASNVVVNLDATTGTGTFNGVLGAMTLTGYVRIDSGTGPYILMQNFGTVPAIALSTGRLIEKYPVYIFTTSDTFLRTLAVRFNSPGTNYPGGDATAYDYCQMTMITVPYDGDFANATTLPTRVTGSISFRLPYARLDNINRPPTLTWRSNYSNTSIPDGAHLYPGLVWKDGNNPQREAGIRIDSTGGSTSADVRLSVVKSGGSAWCEMAGLSFPAQSGRAAKTDIGEVPYSALQVIRGNPSMRWRYRQESTQYDLGPMADDLPPEIQQVMQPSGDVFARTGSMIGLLWKAVEELMEKIEPTGAEA